jgi:hypothetical protein
MKRKRPEQSVVKSSQKALVCSDAQIAEQLITELGLQSNLIAIVKQNFASIPHGMGLIQHLANLIRVILFSPIRLEMSALTVQIFKDLKYPMSILDQRLQQMLLHLRREYKSHFSRVRDFSTVTECRHDADLERGSASFRRRLVMCMLVYILVDAQIFRDGRYREDIREICLAAIANVKNDWLKLSDEMSAFLSSLRQQALVL